MIWWRRLLRQRGLERELDAELRDHIDREIADRVRAGESEADVRRQMRLTSGGVDQVKEACRDVRRPPALADIWADVRFAWRVLARNGWATACAILTLALAMGVANTIFITTYATLWRDFPFERPDRIAIMRTVDARGREAGLSYLDFADWRSHAHVFDGPSAAFAIGTISLGRDGAAPEQFDGLYVSADTFSVLRVKPQLGRDFSAADDRPGAEAVVIISSNIWKSRYAASRDVLGRKVTVNGAIAATIIGVMPDGVRFIDFTDTWLPLAQMPGVTAQRRDTRPLMMIGRMPDGADLDRVRADLSLIAANLAIAHPDTNKDIRPLVNSLVEAYNGGIALTESSIFMPLLAAAFVLLIAAANLANLLLARAAYRSREIAIRLAIGATQWRILRGLLIESLLLAAAAWVVAVGGSWLALRFSASHSAPHLPYWHLKMDARLLGTLAAVALVTTGLFGLAPAVYASRRATADGLKDGGRLSTPPNVRRWTHALLVGQFAITLALLNGAGLAARRFFNFYAADRNVQTSETVSTFIRLPAQTYATRVTLMVRGSGGSRPLVSDVRDAVNAIDPDLALGVVRTLDELRDRSRAGPADMASQFAMIGGLALVFSGVGLYSARAYAVRRRTQEIAVRMALGAQAAQVRWLFLKTAAWVISAGVILGVPAALVVGRLLQNTFVRTEARDPLTLSVTVALLAAVVASFVPARRATRLEPTAALRIE